VLLLQSLWCCCYGGVAAADGNDPPVTVLQPGVRVDGVVPAKVGCGAVINGVLGLSIHGMARINQSID
jgi:hypothetical protein